MSAADSAGSVAAPKRRSQPSGDESATHGPAACLECRSRKVKCNRELPKCSNCKKSGVPCQFPNPEKKSSQMKQLSEDVAAFNGRLSTIEQSISHRMELLTDLVAQSIREKRGKTHHPSPKKGPARDRDDYDYLPLEAGGDDEDDDDINHDDDDDDDDDDDSDDDSTRGGEQSSAESSPSGPVTSGIVVNDGPIKRFYGPSSTYAHLVHSRAMVGKLLFAANSHASSPPSRASSSRSSQTSTTLTGHLGHLSAQLDLSVCVARNAPVLAELQRRFDSFTGPSNFKENFELGDDKAVELPPRWVVEDAVESYLGEYSLEPPLLRRETLMSAIIEQYAANPAEVDESWALCFNNITLRSSAWKSRALRFNSFATGGLDESVLHILLSNANRALRQPERFSKLRLVNIHALFLLALVGRDFIHYNVFERIFDRVCQLAKQMGLHEHTAADENPSLEEQDSSNTLFVLYSVDKQRLFIRGPPCRIYRFECDMQLSPAQNTTHEFIHANHHLMCLVEEIYMHLYAPKACKQDASTLRRRTRRLEKRLANLEARYAHLTAPADSNTIEATKGLHLKYAFCITKLLICTRNKVGRSKQEWLDTARSALQITKLLSDGSCLFNGGIVALDRLFCNYSVIAFYEIFENMLAENRPPASTDLDLLISTTNAVRLLSSPDTPFSYCSRLHKNFAWCTDIASLVYRVWAESNAILPHQPDAVSLEQPAPFDFTGFEESAEEPLPGSLPIHHPLPAQDLDYDMLMSDGGQNHIGATTAGVMTTVDPDFGGNAFGFLPNTLDMTMLNNEEMGLKNDPTSMPSSSSVNMTAADDSVHIQEALQWMLNTEGEFDPDPQQGSNSVRRGVTATAYGRGSGIAM